MGDEIARVVSDLNRRFGAADTPAVETPQRLQPCYAKLTPGPQEARWLLLVSSVG